MDVAELVRPALFFTIFGFSLGFLVSQGFKYFVKSSKPEPKSSQKTVQPADQAEILRVAEHKPTGKLLIYMHGRLLSPGPQLTAEQDKQLTQILGNVYKWMGRSPKIPSPEEARPAAATSGDAGFPAGVPPLPGSARTPQEGASPAGSGPPPSKTAFADSLPEPVQLSDVINPFKKKPKVSSQMAEPAALPKSIVEQIDEILQLKLAGSGLEHLKILMKEKPGQGMAIYVGGEVYEAIDEVPDARVQALIREAAREWNQQQSEKKRGALG